ncbi:hypothetical protein [Oceanobacillus luteolus]|uniref:Uncharacterized protein n=1 Tax=Oceanobacillus luteolus TaxID=1274358 RepID=A0ABW4HN87_9BACI
MNNKWIRAVLQHCSFIAVLVQFIVGHYLKRILPIILGVLLVKWNGRSAWLYLF